MMSDDTGPFGPAIHRYTRAQALADGVLVEVDPQTAREAGLSWPVALTASAWASAVAWDDPHQQRPAVQDEAGRLWDVLTMARHAIGRRDRTNPTGPLTFIVTRIPNTPAARHPRRCALQLLAGPGDTGEPVLTITRPYED